MAFLKSGAAWRSVGRMFAPLRLCTGLALCSALISRPALAADPNPSDESLEPLEANSAAESATPAAAPAEPPLPADAPPPLIWKWRRFSTADYAIGLGAGAITLTAAIVRPRAQHSLSGGIWFDDAVRNAVRVRPLANRYIFRDASDVGLSLAATWPFVADALTAAWWYRGSRDVAQEMALIDLQTLAISGAIQGITNVFVSRERPYGRNCGTAQLPADAIDCDSSGHYRSFYSGHSAFSFTSAALICMNHFENELLGPPWDALNCAGGYAVAATTASFRVLGDMHYASDVLTGALVGTIVGYGVPLLHYRNRSARQAGAHDATLQLELVPSPGGLGVLGIF